MWPPKMEARVLQELAVRRTDRVLEIGTGSGYLTALLAHRAAQVYSVEILPALAAFGQANIARHGVDNVTLEIGDGARGLPPASPTRVPTTSWCSPARCRCCPRALLDSARAGRARLRGGGRCAGDDREAGQLHRARRFPHRRTVRDAARAARQLRAAFPLQVLKRRSTESAPQRCAACLLAVFVVALPAAAQDLQQVYRDAKAYDAQYASARYALQAGLEKLPQGRALVLPSVGLTAATTTNHLGIGTYGPNPVPQSGRTFYNRNYLLSFSQPVYRPQNWLQFDQAEQQVRQAEAVFGQAGQDLIVRVAQAYFDVLAAEDTLALVGAQKIAIAEQLAQAKRNFEVGTATITDTHEAQARFDLAVAQEISAQNDLDNKTKAPCSRSPARTTPRSSRCARRCSCRRPAPTT